MASMMPSGNAGLTTRIKNGHEADHAHHKSSAPCWYARALTGSVAM
jgi:hypothetical protein